MKIEFERPDYCEGCPIADLSLDTITMYTDRDTPCYTSSLIVCKHDAACKRIFEVKKTTDKET